MNEPLWDKREWYLDANSKPTWWERLLLPLCKWHETEVDNDDGTVSTVPVKYLFGYAYPYIVEDIEDGD